MRIVCLGVRRWVWVLLALASCNAFAGIGDGWFARSEFGKEPTCALFGRTAVDLQTAMSVTIVWTASEGPVVRLNGGLSGIPSVLLESVGTDDRWNVTVDYLRQPEFAARQIMISAGDLDRLIDNIGLGHALAITVANSGKAPLRYLDAPDGRKVAVAMYRACVKSMAASPPPAYSKWPGMYLFQMADDSECGFRQIFSERSFPPYITLWVSERGGRIAFMRETVERKPHGRIGKRRKTPDRVNSEALFGQTFDLVESFEFDLTLSQVDTLAADLARGVARNVVMTSPEGESLTLGFGGAYGKASAAMLAACREVKFGSAEKLNP
ncbi:MAG TPA: hypothetical protein VEW08_16825 [Steroidobacteraceae bacterium]|nr:hypothetical protein [Steroidobacteraceae bacterium]